MVILYSQAVFTCGSCCTRAGIRQLGLRTYHMHSTSRLWDLQQVQRTMSMVVAGGGVVHKTPLYNVPPSRESKGPSAMVVLCRLAIFPCGFCCTCRHTTCGDRTYLHCTTRLRDQKQVQMTNSMVEQNGESKRPSVMVILYSLAVLTCGFCCTRSGL